MNTLVATITRYPVVDLDFRPVDLDALQYIDAFLQAEGSPSCDYSVGGIYMWVDYFNYEYCIAADTLFIKGLAQDDRRTPSFAVPIGRLPISEGVEAVRRYCHIHGIKPLFSAVPAYVVADMESVGARVVNELVPWADYIYSAHSLATLEGHAYNKKRNHVNRFIADNPGWRLESLDEGTALEDARRFFADQPIDTEATDIMAEYERRQCADVLRRWRCYRGIFEGAVLRDGSGRVVAFTVGEVVGNTLVVHIEKMDHDIAGAGETINRMFAQYMCSRHAQIEQINREDDAGDEGLRRAKESYHPLYKLLKYNMVID